MPGKSAASLAEHDVLLFPPHAAMFQLRRNNDTAREVISKIARPGARKCHRPLA
jgi:hypothetical protein